jgi:hypothetical protein
MDGLSRRRLEAAGAMCGIVAPLLSFGGFTLIGSAGFAVQPGASLDEVAAIVSQPAPPLAFIGLSLDILGSMAFAVFAARLWGALRRAEEALAWASAGAFGAALLAIAASFVDKTIFAGIFTLAGNGLEPAAAWPLYAVASASFLLFGVFSGLFIGLAAVVVLETGVLHRWLGWLGLVVFALSVIGVVLPEAGFLAFPLVLVWLIATSVLLLRRPLGRPMPA